VVEILHRRASVLRDSRGDGRRFWRLYLESGSGPYRQRDRIYVGPQGGPELREAVKELRMAFWGEYGNVGGLLAAAAKETAKQAREARKAARSAREAVLAQTFRRSHGRAVRNRRDVPAEQRHLAEYQHLSRKALEEATWAGITQEEYVALRKASDRR
jgi:hypothetical protein